MKSNKWKYFSVQRTHAQNRKTYLSLCNQHHPDKPTGNKDKMQEINNEWEEVEKYFKTNISQAPKTKIDYSWKDDPADFRDPFRQWGKYPEEEEEEEEPEEKYVTFKGVKFDLNDDKVLEKVALRFGGLGLMEFTSSKEWQQHINS